MDIQQSTVLFVVKNYLDKQQNLIYIVVDNITLNLKDGYKLANFQFNQFMKIFRNF